MMRQTFWRENPQSLAMMSMDCRASCWRARMTFFSSSNISALLFFGIVVHERGGIHGYL